MTCDPNGLRYEHKACTKPRFHGYRAAFVLERAIKRRHDAVRRADQWTTFCALSALRFASRKQPRHPCIV
jgi:hypothetical protein